MIDRYLAPVPGGHTLLDPILSVQPLVGIAEVAAIGDGLYRPGFLLDYLQIYFMQWAGQMVMFDLRSQIFRHLQRMHIGFYDKNPVGRLVTRTTSDVDALNEMFTSGVVSIFEDVFVLAGIVWFMLRMNRNLALITFAVLPLIAFATKIFRFSRPGARFIPAHSHRHSPHQLLHAGARQRHGGVAAVQPRGTSL